MHTKLKEMELRAPSIHMFCPYTHPQPVVGLKQIKIISVWGHVAYQIKGKEV